MVQPRKLWTFATQCNIDLACRELLRWVFAHIVLLFHFNNFFTCFNTLPVYLHDKNEITKLS